ncbi:MAG: alcohol dehydrogenase catalytic domain-containing protein [Actinomycetota bacterium]|nr:alcohol dehydrogenase catalytic domain-containing protein [Actinomycetota bacterium]
MRAVVFAGPGRVLVDDVPEPAIEHPMDAVVAVEKTAICGSDLHLLSGKTPGMRPGDIIGHEFVGTITELGDQVAGHREGGRVIGSFLIACGRCPPCHSRRFNHCVNRRALGLGPLTGDLQGAQAQYVRIPGADVNLHPLDGVLAELSHEQALFAGDILTTGFYAAALSEVEPTELVAVIGAGPVGLCAAMAVRVQQRHRGRVLVLDSDPRRVAFAHERLDLEAIDVSRADAQEAVRDRSGGTMADVAIEAVGAVDAFRTAMRCARDGGRVSVVGVYGAERYELAMGMTWIRGLDLRFSGMANIQNHWEEALSTVAKGGLDPTALITHRLPLADAEEAYELFSSREAMKVVLSP